MHLIATCDVCPCAHFSNKGSNGDLLGICNFYASFQSANEKNPDDYIKCVVQFFFFFFLLSVSTCGRGGAVEGGKLLWKRAWVLKTR